MCAAVEGFDVSRWQDPEKWDWPALSERHHQLVEEKGTGLFLVARATYGKNTEDRTFVRYAELARAHGLVFGAYHFYRQIHTVEDQLAAWNRQMDRIGGLQPGECFPVLDMEDNSTNGDGRINKKIWNAACDALGDGWKAEHGGCILYYSSYFPDQLGAHQGHDEWKWMQEDGYKYWLADYSVPDGNPRAPYQPKSANGGTIWHLHQNRPRAVPEYFSAKTPVDVNFFNDEGGFTLSDITIAHPVPAVIDDAAPIRPIETEEFQQGLDELAAGLEAAAAGVRRARNA